MHFSPDERIALFIDGVGLYATARALEFDIDYKNLLEAFSEESHLVRAYYYTALVEDQEYSPIRPLIDWLDYNGYTMITKAAKSYTDSMGRRKVKNSMDVEVAVDALEMAAHVDHVVLFSGDGNFRRLVEAVQKKGRQVSVVSTVRTRPPMISDDLRRQADHFIDLSDLRDKVGRRPGQGGRPLRARVAAAGSQHPSNDYVPGVDEFDETRDDDDI